MSKKIKSLGLEISDLIPICGKLSKSVSIHIDTQTNSMFVFRRLLGYGAYLCTIETLKKTGFMGLENCEFEMKEFDTPNGVVTTICTELYFSLN